MIHNSLCVEKCKLFN